MERDKPEQFKPPERFTDLTGKEYQFGGQLRSPVNHQDLSYFYFRNGENTQEHKVFRQSYIVDVIRELAKNEGKPDTGI